MDKRDIPFKTIFTGQHRELYEDVKDLVPTPDYHLSIMEKNQTLTDILSKISLTFGEILNKESPDLLIVQGDTSTVAVTSLIAFYEKIPVGHVEAGLRTYNVRSPFPEEINRQLTSRVTDYHFAPTEKARENLLDEGVSDKQIVVTGNTVIDALLSVVDKARLAPFSDELLRQLSFGLLKPLWID